MLPEFHSVVKKTTHMQETVITQMGLLGILPCVSVSVSVYVCVCACNGRKGVGRKEGSAEGTGVGEVMGLWNLVQRAWGTQQPAWLVR